MCVFALLLFLLLLLVLYQEHTHNSKRVAKTTMPSALPRSQLIKRAAVATAGSQRFSAVPKGAWVGQFLHLLALAVEVPFETGSLLFVLGQAFKLSIQRIIDAVR